MKRQLLKALLLFSLAAVATADARFACADERDEVLAAWKQRQDRVQSFVVRWKERRSVKKGFWTNPEAIANLPPGRLNPPRDITFDCSIEVDADWPKMRVESRDQVSLAWDAPLVPRTEIATYDGASAVDYFPVSAWRFPTASVFARQSNSEANNVHWRPVMLHYRPLDVTVNGVGNMASLRLRESGDTIEGARQIVLESPPHEPIHVTLWIDPAQQYAVRRYVARVGDNIDLQLDMSYANKNGTWRPQNWRLGYLATVSQGPQVSATSTVVECTENIAIPLSRFQQTFAPERWLRPNNRGKTTPWR